MYENAGCSYAVTCSSRDKTSCSLVEGEAIEPRNKKTCFLGYAKTKVQISCAVTSAFVFAI